MADTVKTGMYRWFNRAELEAERVKYIAAVKARSAMQSAAGGGLVAGGTIGGKSVSFTFPAGIGSLEEWANALEDAFAQLDELPQTLTDTARATY